MSKIEKNYVSNMSYNQYMQNTQGGPLLPAFLFLTSAGDSIAPHQGIPRDYTSSLEVTTTPRQSNDIHGSVPLTFEGPIVPYERVIVGDCVMGDIGVAGSSNLNPVSSTSVGSISPRQHRTVVPDSSYDELFSKAIIPFLPNVISSCTDTATSRSGMTPLIKSGNRGRQLSPRVISDSDANEKDVLFIFVPSGRVGQSHGRGCDKETRSGDIHTFLQMIVKCAGRLVGGSLTNPSGSVRTIARMSIIQYNSQLDTVYDLLSNEITEEDAIKQNEDPDHSRVYWLKLGSLPSDEDTSSSTDNANFSNQNKCIEQLKRLFFSYEEVAEGPHAKDSETRYDGISLADRRQGVIGKLLRLSSAADFTIVTIEENVYLKNGALSRSNNNFSLHMRHRIQFLFLPVSIHVPQYQDISRSSSPRGPSGSVNPHMPSGSYYSRASAAISRSMQRVVSRQQQERNTLKEFLGGSVVLSVAHLGVLGDVSHHNWLKNIGVNGDGCQYCSYISGNNDEKLVYYREGSVLLDCLLLSRQKENEEAAKEKFPEFSTLSCKYCSSKSTPDHASTIVNRATTWAPKQVVLIGLSHSSRDLESHSGPDQLPLKVPHDDVFEFISDIMDHRSPDAHHRFPQCNQVFNSYGEGRSVMNSSGDPNIAISLPPLQYREMIDKVSREHRLSIEGVLCCCSYLPDMLPVVKPFPTDALIIGRKEIPHYMLPNYRNSNIPLEADSRSSSSSSFSASSFNSLQIGSKGCVSLSPLSKNPTASANIIENNLICSSPCSDLKAIDEVRKKRRSWRNQTGLSSQALHVMNRGPLEGRSAMEALGRVLEVAYELADRSDTSASKGSLSIYQHQVKRQGTEELVAPFKSLLDQLTRLQATNQQLFTEGCIFSDLYRLENNSSALLAKQLDVTRRQHLAFIYYTRWKNWLLTKYRII
eukprot:Tbor_TRINITY_DN4473_c0_g1::TRINITY_DN4473_c0_g1_i3::g.7998::m.7998